MKVKELLEKLELIDKADPEFGLGDYYFASSEQDVFDSLDKMTLSDSVGVFLKHKELDERHELTIELVEPDLYIMKIEEDSPETADDWEGKTLQDTDLISKEDVINTLDSIFQDYRVLTAKERRELHQLASQNENLDTWYAIYQGEEVIASPFTTEDKAWQYARELEEEEGIDLDTLSVGPIAREELGYTDDELEYFKESLKGYKEVAKILQNKEDGGFNVAEQDEPMLVEDQPTLKTLLNNLVKYL